jgi:hypothetical protein
MRLSDSILQVEPVGRFNIIVLIKPERLKSSGVDAVRIRQSLESELKACGVFISEGGCSVLNGKALISIFSANLDLGLCVVDVELHKLRLTDAAEIGTFDGEEKIWRSYSPVTSKPFDQHFQIADTSRIKALTKRFGVAVCVVASALCILIGLKWRTAPWITIPAFYLVLGGLIYTAWVGVRKSKSKAK